MTARQLLDAGDMLRKRIARALPSLVVDVENVVEHTGRFSSYVAHSQMIRSAEATIALQACNVCVDLLSDAERGRGRPVLASARTLIELAISARVVLAGPASAERYAAHQVIGAYDESRLTAEQSQLQGTERRAHTHRMRKLARQVDESYSAVVARYGHNFQRQWDTKSLADRAKQFGLVEEYTFYRFASKIVHGSAYGVSASLLEQGTDITHRVGPALRLCPPGLLYGVRAMRALVSSYGTSRGGPSAPLLVSALETLMSRWGAYRGVIIDLDTELWANNPGGFSVAMVAIDPLCELVRWYLHDSAAGLVVAAVPPTDIPESVSRLIDELVDRARREPPSETWITVAALGVHVQAKPGARWIDERAFFE